MVVFRAAMQLGEEVQGLVVTMEVLAAAYPGRRIVPVDARELFARGGGVHCITQQQPKAGLSA